MRGGESPGEGVQHLDERERVIRAGAWRGKVDSIVKEGRIQKGEGGQARRAYLVVQGSMSE